MIPASEPLLLFWHIPYLHVAYMKACVMVHTCDPCTWGTYMLLIIKYLLLPVLVYYPFLWQIPSSKTTWRGKGSLGLHFLMIVWSWGKPKLKLKTGTTKQKLGETREIWFTGLLSIACSVCFLRQPMSTSPGTAQPAVGWALSHQSWIKKSPIDLLTGQSDGGNSPVEVCSSRRT